MWPFLYPKPNKTLSPSKKNMFIYSSDKTANTFWKELNVILAAIFDITFLMNASGDVVFHSLSCNVHWGMTGGFYGDVCPRRRTWLRARERSGSAQLFFTRSNSTARCPQSEKGLAAPITTRVWGGKNALTCLNSEVRNEALVSLQNLNLFYRCLGHASPGIKKDPLCC